MLNIGDKVTYLPNPDYPYESPYYVLGKSIGVITLAWPDCTYGYRVYFPDRECEYYFAYSEVEKAE